MGQCQDTAPHSQTWGEGALPSNRSRAGRQGAGGFMYRPMVKNRDLVVGLMVAWKEPDQDGAVASAPSSESHTSDCR